MTTQPGNEAKRFARHARVIAGGELDG